MKDFLEYILSRLVDHPKDIKIEEKSFGENIYHYLITANQNDIGQIIGREGKIIRAIRNITRIIAVQEGKQVRIEVG